MRKAMEQKKFCTGCGTKLDPSFKFCPNCGEDTLLRTGGDSIRPAAPKSDPTDILPGKNISPQTKKLLEDFDLQFKALEQKQGNKKKGLAAQIAPGTKAGDTYRFVMIGIASVSIIIAMAVFFFIKNYMFGILEAMKKASGN